MVLEALRLNDLLFKLHIFLSTHSRLLKELILPVDLEEESLLKREKLIKLYRGSRKGINIPPDSKRPFNLKKSQRQKLAMDIDFKTY